MARVLIVDDDDGTRETVRAVLEDAGYEVAEAADGCRALDCLRTGSEPLVVLLDYRMPRMSGGELLCLAVHEGLHARHCFALMLASPELAEDDAHLHEHVHALDIPMIAKPFDIDTLLSVVACRAASLASVHAGAGE